MLVGRACAVALLALVGCREAPPPAEERGPPPMPPAEQDRGLAICDGFVARLCSCAEGDPALAAECDLARSRPEALRLHVALLRGVEGPLNAKERREAEAAARQVVAACVKADAALDPAKCPRPAGGGAK